MSRVQASPAFLSVPEFVQPAKGTCLLCGGSQEWDTQSVAWLTHSPGWVTAPTISLFLRVSSGAQALTRSLFLPSYPITCGSFLQPLLYRSPSASFQLIFSENCPTCRCIFVVFVGGSELHVLLLHHLDFSPPTLLLISLFPLYKQFP